MKRFPLHYQILLALILGAVFGALLPVDHSLLEIEHADGVAEVTEWRQVRIAMDMGAEGMGEVKLIEGPDAAAVVDYFAGLKSRQRAKVVLDVDKGEGSELSFRAIRSIRKHGTWATAIDPLGTLFLNLLKMVAIPLVLGSLIVGAASLGDVGRMARMGGKTIGFYLVTTSLAISLGLLAANLVQPGSAIPTEVKDRLMTDFGAAAEGKLQSVAVDLNPLDFVLSLVPTNPFDAMAEGSMLHIVFFAVFFGMMLSLLPREKGHHLLKFFEGLSDVSIKMVDVIMLIAPIGVFALMAATISNFGIGILNTLLWYVLTVVGALLIHAFVVYPLILSLAGRINIVQFFRGIRKAMLVAFSTSSSAATLPVTMECADEMGVPKSVSSFVLPLGATINMDGTALYQGVAAVFIAQVFQVDLTLGAQLGIVLTATLASIGTAPIPGVGIVMLIVVLQQAGIPAEGIALILGVDRILDMMRTTVNVTGDASASVFVAKSEGLLANVNAAR